MADYNNTDSLIGELPGIGGYSGHMMFRAIRPKYPLPSQQVNDMFDEMILDLNFIIDFKIDLTSFTEELTVSVNALERVSSEQNMAGHRPAVYSRENDHTNDWRTL
ncbi:hypothetical protein [Acinetobacter sp.]|uniref:hypothetical protein n=1 Tax=Acinetobacter sp. TaxID=472 RepID=UPI003D0174CE